MAEVVTAAKSASEANTLSPLLPATSESTYAFVAASCAELGSATLVIRLDPILIVCELLTVTPLNVDVPSTVSWVPLISCKLSLLNLALMLLLPAFLCAISIIPSSVPSLASKILPVILAYITSWSASFSPLNFICPR